MTRTIQDIFKQFCKERHTEDKGKNYDLLQEVYANTEFFDMEFLDRPSELPELTNFICEPLKNSADFPIENFNLPFQNLFVHWKDKCYVFLREYAPDIITGTFYLTNCSFLNTNKFVCEGTLNIPFTIRLSNNFLTMSRPSIIVDYKGFSKFGELNEIFNTGSIENEEGNILELKVPIEVCKVLNALSHKSIAVDKPVNTYYEYYRRKRKPTLKIPQRPIYYVLGEKEKDVSAKYKYIQPTGTLEYSYAFRVRGHWRRIGDKTFGKDRNGIYNVKGYTWVTDYTKGEGELAKRIRVVK